LVAISNTWITPWLPKVVGLIGICTGIDGWLGGDFDRPYT
jgi:hypothetical protein